MTDVITIEKAALQLPDEEKARLADRLLDSISQSTPELRESWIIETEARMKAYQEGEITDIDGPSAITSLKKRYEK
jgi:putative addiction module component (TIGR02574 family)